MEDFPKQNFAITIGRSFGSGGRQIGRKLAQALGISYYDKELLHDAAERSNLNPEIFEKRDERFPNYISGTLGFTFGFSPAVWYNHSNAISDDSVYHAQSDFILEAARSGSCVIVGRSADYVLRYHPRLIKIFLTSSGPDRVRRIIERGDASDESAALALAKKTDKLRANYYNFYTDKQWGAASSYDICIDTSVMHPDTLVAVLKEYVHHRLAESAAI